MIALSKNSTWQTIGAKAAEVGGEVAFLEIIEEMFSIGTLEWLKGALDTHQAVLSGSQAFRGATALADLADFHTRENISSPVSMGIRAICAHFQDTANQPVDDIWRTFTAYNHAADLVQTMADEVDALADSQSESSHFYEACEERLPDLGYSNDLRWRQGALHSMCIFVSFRVRGDGPGWKAAKNRWMEQVATIRILEFLRYTYSRGFLLLLPPKKEEA